MKHHKKAQSAMEFMMTYGWAILIVIIALAAVSYFVATGRAFFLPERCVIPTGSGLFCEDFVAYPGVIILRIRNALPDSVEITNASVTQDGNTCYLPTTINIPAGGVENVGLAAGGIPCFDLTQHGAKIKGDVKVTYKKRYLPRDTTGDLIVKVTETTAYICENADKNGLCDGLNPTFGVGYKEECCNRHEKCCP